MTPNVNVSYTFAKNHAILTVALVTLSLLEIAKMVRSQKREKTNK